MWCRAILTTVVISCTFAREIISQDERLGQLKDMICMLLLNGGQKEDLDPITLDKLRRHNVNIDDLNNEKTRQECLIHTNKGIEQNEFYIELPTIYNGVIRMTLTKNEEKTKQTPEYPFLDVANMWTDLQNVSSSTAHTIVSRNQEYEPSNEVQLINRLVTEYLANLTVTTQPPPIEDKFLIQFREMLEDKYKEGRLNKLYLEKSHPINNERDVKEIVSALVKNIYRNSQKNSELKKKNNKRYVTYNNEQLINPSKYKTQNMFKKLISKQINNIFKDDLGTRPKEVVNARKKGFNEENMDLQTYPLNTPKSDYNFYNNLPEAVLKPRASLPLTRSKNIVTDMISKQIGDILNDNDNTKPKVEVLRTKNDNKGYYLPSIEVERPSKDISPEENPYIYKQKDTQYQANKAENLTEEINLHVKNVYYPTKHINYITKDGLSQIIDKEVSTKFNKVQLNEETIKELADAVKSAVLRDMRKDLVKEDTTALDNTVMSTSVTYTTEKVTARDPEIKEVRHVIYKLNELYNEFKTLKENVEMATGKPLRLSIKINDEPIKAKVESDMETDTQTFYKNIRPDSETPISDIEIPINSDTRPVFQYHADDRRPKQKTLTQTHASDIQPIIMPLQIIYNTKKDEVIVTTPETNYFKYKQERNSKKRLEKLRTQAIKTQDYQLKTHDPELMLNKSKHIDYNNLYSLSSTERPQSVYHPRSRIGLKDYSQGSLSRFDQDKLSHRDSLLDLKEIYPRHHYSSATSRESGVKDWKNLKYETKHPSLSRDDTSFYLKERQPGLQNRLDDRRPEIANLGRHRDLERLRSWSDDQKNRYLSERLYEGPKYHQKLENIHNTQMSNLDKYRNKYNYKDPSSITSREQMPLAKAKKLAFEASFNKFVQTQRKVNDMLAKMIARKKSKLRNNGSS